MKTTSNKIPNSQAPLLQLGIRAITGAETHGADTELKHNTAPDIAADVYDLAGNPATPLVPGKQAQFNAKKEALKSAYVALRGARATAREFCRQAIALLKGTLGTSYNGNWEAAGFLTPSLAVPDHPVPMLLQFRQYFERFPAKEVVSLGLTADQAQACTAAIQAAELAVAAAKSERVKAKKLRDAAQKALYRRLSDLRSELEQLLEDDDGRWYAFGFHRPIDGRLPDPVEGIEFTPLAPGIVGVAWDHAARAESYRVKWFMEGGSSPITEAGLFTDRQCTLLGVPATGTIVIAISSRNGAGETPPSEKRVVSS